MFEYIILGALQGLFEWIPVSSEGIIALASQCFIKETNPIDLALFLHSGTLFAVLIYFRKDWKEVLTLKNIKLLKFLVITSFVSLIIGFPIYKLVRNIAMGNSLLVIMGIGLLLTAYLHKTKKSLKISFGKLALISGFLQGLSVIPGLSRSGSTIFGLSLRESSPAETLKVSYMMSVPVILLSSCYLFLESPGLGFKGWPSLASGFLVGLLSLHLLINLVKRIDFFRFALIFSILCFLGAIVGFIF